MKKEVLQQAAEVPEDHIANWPVEKIMRQLVREGRHLDQDAVYNSLREGLPEEEIIDKIQRDYTGPIGDAIITKVRSVLGDAYIGLLIEPSIGTRADELIAFAESQNQELPPFELREKFKESLGYTRVYRATALSDQELQEVLRTGFLANYYRTHSTDQILANADGYESIEYNLGNLIGSVNVHAGAFATTKDSMLISTSNFPEMAQYAAFVQLKESWSAQQAVGRKFYLIPIDIEEFRNVRYGKYLPPNIQAKGTWHSNHRDIPYNDPGVESFVEFRIPAENIGAAEIREIDVSAIPNFKFVPRDKA